VSSSSTPFPHPPIGTLYILFDPSSHVTTPEFAILMYLYSNDDPGARAIVTNQRGSEAVYCAAERAGQDSGAQFPSAGIEPQMCIVSPNVVDLRTLNVSEMVEGVGQAELELVDEEVGVPVAVEKSVFVTVVYGPVADPAEHTAGIVLAEFSPHDAGLRPLRRLAAVMNAA
jgi:hypothetical protein